MKALKIMSLILAWALAGAAMQIHVLQLQGLWMLVVMIGTFITVYKVLADDF